VAKTREQRKLEAQAALELLRRRLKAEGETELLAKISICQQPLEMLCVDCGTKKTMAKSCKRKWCPCCKRRLAAQRSAELGYIVERFRWPLFVTLTMKNAFDLSSGEIRKMRRAFGKLRNRKLWKTRVKGGIACVEVTNIGNGWHPHLHCVLDCAWLAWKTPAPQKGDSKEELKAKFQAAAVELETAWAKLLGQTSASVKVKRCSSSTIAKEVVKYTVKDEDLIESEEPIGELIRALESCRLMTTFGQAHGKCVGDIRRAARLASRDNNRGDNKTGEKTGESRGDINETNEDPEAMSEEEQWEWVEPVQGGETPRCDKREEFCLCKSGGAWIPAEVFDMRLRKR
jgi:hypothetical protein